MGCVARGSNMTKCGSYGMGHNLVLEASKFIVWFLNKILTHSVATPLCTFRTFDYTATIFFIYPYYNLRYFKLCYHVIQYSTPSPTSSMSSSHLLLTLRAVTHPRFLGLAARPSQAQLGPRTFSWGEKGRSGFFCWGGKGNKKVKHTIWLPGKILSAGFGIRCITSNFVYS